MSRGEKLSRPAGRYGQGCLQGAIAMKDKWLASLPKRLFSETGKAAAAGNGAGEKAEKTFCAMGTVMSFAVHGAGAREMLESAIAVIKKLDALLARMKPDSEIARLNMAAGGGWLGVQEDTDAVLRLALRYAEQTGGAYDPAIGALVDLWSIKNRREQNVPDANEIGQALTSCDYRQIETDKVGRYRLLQGASIDLGGIGKGYAADRVYTLCQEYGAPSALFSLGMSSVAALGSRPDDSAWKIGLKTADTAKFACFGVVHLQNQFLSTSGDYEQCFVRDGRRYHHILDRSTGYPADSGLRSVTVIADSGAMSEAYSTALFIMGLDRALAFQQRQGGFEAIMVTSDNRVVCTPGAREVFEFKGKALGYDYPQNL
jgi:thiamine biosynthesis lipoprotein